MSAKSAIVSKQEPIKNRTLFLVGLGTARVALGVFLFWLIAPGAVTKFKELYGFSKMADHGSQELNSMLRSLGGKTAFLIAQDNNYRPRSVNSAICKGGMNIFKPVWGVSKYIEGLFPRQACFIISIPVDITAFNNAVLIRLKERNETKEMAIGQAEKFFSLSLLSYDCSREIDFPDSVAVICSRFKPRGKATSAPKRKGESSLDWQTPQMSLKV